MLDDIDNEKINLVITKDLSRLGRDYIETGRYIEKIFPSKNIRYIAVNDNIDTFDKRNSNNDMTPFKAVINDMYAKDTSNKVRSTILTKAIAGECIKAFLPYGYKKDKIDKNKILVDENVAENVKLIFNLYKDGKSKTEIAKKLNELEIPTPLKYKKETTKYYNPNSNATYKWNSTVINKILSKIRKHHKVELIFILLLITTTLIFDLSTFYQLKMILNYALTPSNIRNLFILISMFFVISVLKLYSNYLIYSLQIKINYDIRTNLNNKIIEKVLLKKQIIKIIKDI